MSESADPKAESADPKTEPADPKATSWTAHTTVAVAVLGAAWFCLLVLAATIAYTPAGVRPDEIGMDSTTVLTQAVAGLIVTLLLMALIGVIASSVHHERLPTHVSGGLALVLAAVTLGVAGSILSSAKSSADNLEAGKKGRDRLLWIPLPSPWSAEVVVVFWAQGGTAGGPSSLPRCVLYLGQANGTSVLYDAKLKRTWRIPSARLIIRGNPSANHCP